MSGALCSMVPRVNIVRKQRDQLFTHLYRMSPDFYQRYSSGDLMAHATNDLNAVEDCAGGGIMTLIDSIIAGVTVLAAMIFVVNGQLTLMVLAPFPLLIWATGRLRHHDAQPLWPSPGQLLRPQ